jgi:antibiotic biosynthesis monooxygenase (ABM) superfamily enzyme
MNVLPVTTVVRRHVKPGREADYETWLTALQTDAHALPGYLGAEVLRPRASGEPYVSIFRFVSPATLHAFETSDIRKRHLARLPPLVDAEAELERLSGLEVWFDPPPGTVAAQPVRWRMVILLIVTVLILVEALGLVVRFVLPDLPRPAATALVVVMQVLLLTYVFLPALTRRFAFWLFPVPKPANGVSR